MVTGRVAVPPLPWTALQQIAAPRHPDPYVFGPPLPNGADIRGAPEYVAGGERHCWRHPGITWRGTEDCWCCNPASETEKRR